MKRKLTKLSTPGSVLPHSPDAMLNDALADQLDAYLMIRRDMVSPTEERTKEVQQAIIDICTVLLDEYGLSFERMVYLQNTHGLTLAEVLWADFTSRQARQQDNRLFRGEE